MAHYIQDNARIQIVSSFDYRGQPEEFSNRFSFADRQPIDDVTWKAMADALIAQMRTCFPATTTFVRAYGYAPAQFAAVWVHDYASPGPPLAGTWTTQAGSSRCQGDAAATLRYTSAKKSVRGKTVYGRNYFHDVYDDGVGAYDRLSQSQQAAFTTFGTSLCNGSIHPRLSICLPNGTWDLFSPHCDQWLTTRTLKRRGKRKINPPSLALAE